MMVTEVSETCWADYKCNKPFSTSSCFTSLSTYNDARTNTHQNQRKWIFIRFKYLNLNPILIYKFDIFHIHIVIHKFCTIYAQWYVDECTVVFIYTSLSDGCNPFMIALQGPNHVEALTIYRLLTDVCTQCVSLCIIRYFLHHYIYKISTSMFQVSA
jgi:hypothetical protein